MNKISIAVTGHRPNKLWGYDLNHVKYKQLESLLIKTIAEITWDRKLYRVPVECVTGMALGVDTIFANAVLNMKINFTGLFKLISAVPCLEQDKLWKANDKATYKYLLSQADEIVYVSKEPYNKGCMNKRNQYMIDRCDILIAVWNGDGIGGTADAVKRAKKVNKEIIIIDPKLL